MTIHISQPDKGLLEALEHAGVMPKEEQGAVTEKPQKPRGYDDGNRRLTAEDMRPPIKAVGAGGKVSSPFAESTRPSIESNDDLEVGLAAGLDIPTAIVLATPSYSGRKPHRFEVWLVAIVTVFCLVWELTKLF